MGQDVSVVVGAGRAWALLWARGSPARIQAGWCWRTSRATRSPGSPSGCATQGRTAWRCRGTWPTRIR